MTNTYQTDLDDDDALGLAMRAFVDEMRAKGAECEDVIFALAVETTRAALDLHADRASVLRIVLSAASDVTRLTDERTATSQPG